jgi:hypothetical protein
MNKESIEKLLSDEKKHLEKLHTIVKKTIDDEELIIHNLTNLPIENLTQGQKISDKVALFEGQLEVYYFVFYCIDHLDHF